MYTSNVLKHLPVSFVLNIWQGLDKLTELSGGELSKKLDIRKIIVIRGLVEKQFSKKKVTSERIFSKLNSR